MNVIYQKVILVGRTQLIKNCLDVVKKYICNDSIEIIGVPQHGVNYLDRVLSDENDYAEMEKESLMQYLRHLSQKSLILSIMNPYIFPESVLGNSNVTIVNLHHALLPRHPGRNAEAWAIYEEDKEAGVTWHYVDNGIDTGRILIQKKMPLSEQITSFQLYQKLNMLAVTGLSEIIQAILQGDAVSHSQKGENSCTIHKAKDRPNQGILNPEWDEKKISAFLRSMDYGILRTMGYPLICLKGSFYQCKSYKILPRISGMETLTMENGYLYCNKQTLSFKIKISKRRN